MMTTDAINVKSQMNSRSFKYSWVSSESSNMVAEGQRYLLGDLSYELQCENALYSFISFIKLELKSINFIYLKGKMIYFGICID